MFIYYQLFTYFMELLPPDFISNESGQPDKFIAVERVELCEIVGKLFPENNPFIFTPVRQVACPKTEMYVGSKGNNTYLYSILLETKINLRDIILMP